MKLKAGFEFSLLLGSILWRLCLTRRRSVSLASCGLLSAYGAWMIFTWTPESRRQSYVPYNVEVAHVPLFICSGPCRYTP